MKIAQIPAGVTHLKVTDHSANYLGNIPSLLFKISDPAKLAKCVFYLSSVIIDFNKDFSVMGNI